MFRNKFPYCHEIIDHHKFVCNDHTYKSYVTHKNRTIKPLENWLCSS